MATTLSKKITILNQILGSGQGFFIVSTKKCTHIGTVKELVLEDHVLIMRAQKSFSFFGEVWRRFKTKNHWGCKCGNFWGYSLNNNCGDSFFSNIKNTGMPIAVMQIYAIGTVMLFKDRQDFVRQLDFLGSMRNGVIKEFPKIPKL